MPHATKTPDRLRPAAASRPVPPQDVRRRKPPLLSFLLRWETLRRVGRVASLMAIDFAGLFLALLTALVLKEFLTIGQVRWNASLDATSVPSPRRSAWAVMGWC